ncbi:MAG: heavy metal translocating P-type ATPase metal-binding domain-containing protein, partial [Acetobacteraceae bacterium]
MTAALLARAGPSDLAHPAADLSGDEDSGACAHCGQPSVAGRRFCCPGCAVAFDTIQHLGLGSYYRQRVLDPDKRPPRPDVAEQWDLGRYVTTRDDGSHELTLAVDGLQCGACVWLIESVLAKRPEVMQARINMTLRRLKLVWHGDAGDAGHLIEAVQALGYRLVPFDAQALAAANDQTGRELVRALAVAGFAAGNVMLISIGVWAGEAAGWLDGMGQATRDLLHWVSALIALPAIAYAGRPFFRSATASMRQGRTNMDVPISVGVVLVSALSLSETLQHGPHTYFDSAITLLFFLLIGRVLDHRARGQARATAEQLLTLRVADAMVLLPDGTTVRRSQQAVAAGDRVLVGLGERVSVDGVVASGASSLDTSLVTGESMPVAVAAGSRVFAGTLNLGAPLTIRATATGSATLLAECVRLIEAAEARRSRFVVLADRVARRYAPAVHVAALLTFLGWYFGLGASAADALLIASAVLIVTCPCALALAVPAVQVIATSRLFRAGALLKSPTALERLAEVDTVVFDKTGTLTEPVLALVRDG